MLRKVLLLLAVTFIFPVFATANAWTLSTRVLTIGGTLQVGTNTPQTSSNGTVSRTFAANVVVPVTLTPSPGYQISTVTINGVTQSLPLASNSFNLGLVAYPGKNSQAVTVNFAKQFVSVTSSADNGGTVYPSGTSTKMVSSIADYTFTPNAGLNLVAVSGAPAGTTYTDVSVTPNVAVVLPAPLNHVIRMSFTVPTSSVTFAGKFVGVYANAGPPQTVLTGQAATLSGSATVSDGSASVNYVWSQVGGPAVGTLTNATMPTATFTSAMNGTYTLRLVATSSNGASSIATTSVTVTNSAATAARNKCANCHANAGVGPTIYDNWSSSMHKVKVVVCANCHIGADTGAHPSTLVSGSVNNNTFNYTGTSNNFCVTCHSPAIITEFAASKHSVRAGATSCSFCHVQGVHNPNTACVDCHKPGNSLDLPWPPAGLDFHNDYNGTNLCTNCHNLHNPASVSGISGAAHYNNITSGIYPASYMTSRAACADCHHNSPTNASHRQEWNKSGHAAFTDPAWTAYDFKTRAGCVQCHTTTGFIAYSTGRVTAAWGVASDKTKEVLRCNGCHKDVQNGIVRTVAPVRPYADDPYINRDLGKSNICMSCHSGVRNGASITVQLDALADFTNLPFIDPHNHASGGNLHGKSGYHFPGQTYAFYSTNSHRKIGIADLNGSGTSGPCISCHRNDTNSHTNKSLINTLCGNCHGASFTVDQLYVVKQEYTNALTALNAMLAAKNHPYSPTPPYFSNTNWGSGQAGANTMGAAFNYVMLLKDQGAYAHNGDYTKKLIFDSIDYLFNGTVTGNVDSAVASLVDNGITQAQADSLIAYKNSNSCTDCHSNTSRSHPAHLNSGFGCNECHNATALSSSALVPGTTTHLNGTYDLEAGTGRSFSYTYASSGGTCSSISCHNNGTATWGGTLGCDGCHDAPPATASHLKHYGGTIAQAAYGDTRITQDFGANGTKYIFGCGNCHPMDKARHGNGTVDIELYNPLAPAGSLKALNPATAAYVADGTVFTDSRGLPYTSGTCSNIYCHSYNEWTTIASIPADDPTWQDKTVVTRRYQTPTWGGTLGCSGCHGNPTQTTYLTNDGGAGDSHAWIDSYGYGNLHTYNMGYAPVTCNYCHNDTVKQPNTYTRNSMDVTVLGDVPISGFSKHVNGITDVSFNKQNPFVYPVSGGTPVYMSLANATYDQTTKTCSNVSCHIQETTVKWGTPYRFYYDQCDRCHDYGNH